MFHAPIFVLMRWLHIVSAASIIGGLLLIVLSAGPVRSLIGNDEASLVIKRVESRYRWVLGIAMFALVVSGVYQWMIFGRGYEVIGAIVLVVLSVKVLLAVTVFALLWAFQTDSMVDKQARTWRWVNLVLALLVVILAGIVRYIRIENMCM